MIAYLESSVLLRIVLREPTPLKEWSAIDLGVASPLVQVECHRTLDRLWLTHQLNEAEVSDARREVSAILSRLLVVPLDGRILERAAGSMPLPLKTLDALHLVSAMQFREGQSAERHLVFATHDFALAKAARAMQFDVIGANET